MEHAPIFSKHISLINWVYAQDKTGNLIKDRDDNSNIYLRDLSVTSAIIDSRRYEVTLLLNYESIRDRLPQRDLDLKIIVEVRDDNTYKLLVCAPF